jgi:hypothetical protein
MAPIDGKIPDQSETPSERGPPHRTALRALLYITPKAPSALGKKQISIGVAGLEGANGYCHRVVVACV